VDSADISKLKRSLEKKLLTELNEYENITGCKIHEINLELNPTEELGKRIIFVDVKTMIPVSIED